MKVSPRNILDENKQTKSKVHIINSYWCKIKDFVHMKIRLDGNNTNDNGLKVAGI